MLKTSLISGGIGRSGCTIYLPLEQQFMFSFCHFRVLQNLHLVLGGLFKFKYLTQSGSGKTTERSPNRRTPRRCDADDGAVLIN